MEKHYTVLIQAAAYFIGFLVLYFLGSSPIKNLIESRRKNLEQKEENERRETYKSNLILLASAMRLLENQSEDQNSGVDRAILFEGHNGGGMPRPGHPYYCDVIHPEVLASDEETAHLTREQIIAQYSNLEVDLNYIEMLVETIRIDHVWLVVDEMPKNALLRKIYEREGVKYSLVSYIAIKGESMFYMSQACYHSPLTNDQRLQAELVVNQMRTIFK